MNKQIKSLVYFSLILFAFSVFSLSFVSAWTLSGTVYDDLGNALNNTNVTIASMFAPGGGAPTFFNENTTQSNASGFFNLTVLDNSTRNYLITLKHSNSTTNKVDFVGQSLPYFPNQMFSSNMNINFYMKPAGTINITAINSTGDRINFNYQIKDSQLGYTLDNNWNTQNGASEADVYLPLDKNYSIMIYPRGNSMPLSYSWTNFTSQTNYAIDSLSNYTASSRVLLKQFNTTSSMLSVTGYINGSSLGINGWDNFTVIPMIMESGRFIFLQHSAMPYNMGSWVGQSDSYNFSTGFFNITLPGPAETQTILLYVSALNGSNYYGSYKNITMSYGGNGEYNFTMYGLLGSLTKNISMGGSGFGGTNIATKMMSLNLINATDNQTLNMATETHVEVVLDYSSIGVSEFVVTDSVSAGNSAFYLPMLNISGSKEINVFSNNFAPRRVDQRTAAQLVIDNTIGLSNFNPQTRDGGHTGASINMIMITSNSSCDIPNPGVACYKGSPNGNMADFNPISAIMGGGKISFRMGYGNVSVHYVNVDMLASGPPDAAFDSQTNESISTGFQSVMKFGSNGPKIYDYVLVSMPYDERLLKEFQPVNISIPLLYDENWNVIWNVSANGTNPNALSGNYSHYAGKESAWGNLTQSNICTRGILTSSNQINETNPCYIDTSNNKIWIRIPHFSGTEPQVSGVTSSSRYTVQDGIEYLSPTETSGTYVARNSILINVTSNITNFVNISISLYNSTRDLNLTSNSTDPSYSINISGLPDGLWFFNATVYNDTAAFNSTVTRNITIDTIKPTSINNGSLTPLNNSIVNSNSFIVNITSYEINLANITIRLYDSVMSLINNSFISMTSSNYSANFTSLSDANGLYFYDAIIYDLAGNSNISLLKQVILNTSSPVISSTSASVSTTTATVSFTSNKSVNATISYGTARSLGTNGTEITTLSTTGSFSLTGLSASTTYYYNITICDRAGNCYINGTNSFTTSAVAVVETATGNGGTVTNVPVTIDLSAGYTKLMIVAEQLKFNIGTEQHSVFVQSLISDSLVLKIASTPQIATFKVGEEKRFELTGDNYYDLYIKFNSIKSGAVNLTIKTIYESMTGQITLEPETNVSATTNATTTGAEPAASSSNVKIIAIIVIVVLIIAAVGYYLARRKNKYY